MPDSTDNVATENGSPPAVIKFQEHRPMNRASLALNNWARYTFSREKVINGAKTLLWVAPLTLLIWVYAEREQLTPQDNITIPIEVTSNDPLRVVTLLRPQPSLLIATLTGPKAKVEAVKNMLHPGGSAIRIEVDRNMGTGPQRIDAARIGNDSLLKDQGVSVSNCQPPFLDIYVDPIIEMAIPVQAPPGMATIGTVTFTPDSVQVSGPEKVLSDANSGDKRLAAIAVSLPSRPEVLSASPTERQVSVSDVKLTVPIENRFVKLVGATSVSAKVDLKASKEYKPAFIPVAVVADSDVLDKLNRYKVEFDSTLKDIVLAGPEEKIDMISRPDYTPQLKALFEITLADFNSDLPRTVPLDFKLPPGVAVKAGTTSITFRLTNR